MKRKENPRTTISLQKETYDRLKQAGRFGESFDKLLVRLLEKE